MLYSRSRIPKRIIRSRRILLYSRRRISKEIIRILLYSRRRISKEIIRMIPEEIVIEMTNVTMKTDHREKFERN